MSIEIIGNEAKTHLYNLAKRRNVNANIFLIKPGDARLNIITGWINH